MFDLVVGVGVVSPCFCFPLANDYMSCSLSCVLPVRLELLLDMSSASVAVYLLYVFLDRIAVIALVQLYNGELCADTVERILRLGAEGAPVRIGKHKP